MSDTKNVEKKGKGHEQLSNGPGQGCAQQHRRDIPLKKGRETVIRGEISRRMPFQNQSLGSMGPRKANLEAG